MTKHITELSIKQQQGPSDIFGTHANFKKRERHYWYHGMIPATWDELVAYTSRHEN